MNKFHKIYISLIIILLVAAGFFAYKFFTEDNTNIPEIETKYDINLSENNGEDIEEVKVVITNNAESPSVSTQTDSGEIEKNDVLSSEEEVSLNVSAPVNPIDVTLDYVSQSILGDVGYEYGGYIVSLSITANSGDIYIPKSTTDSTTGVTGFPYSITGDIFRGGQYSSVECSLVSQDNYCKIKKGNTSTIKVIVWLYPDMSGNYGIKFESLRYSLDIDGYFSTFNIGISSDNIYI